MADIIQELKPLWHQHLKGKEILYSINDLYNGLRLERSLSSDCAEVTPLSYHDLIPGTGPVSDPQSRRCAFQYNGFRGRSVASEWVRKHFEMCITYFQWLTHQGRLDRVLCEAILNSRDCIRNVSTSILPFPGEKGTSKEHIFSELTVIINHLTILFRVDIDNQLRNNDFEGACNITKSKFKLLGLILDLWYLVNGVMWLGAFTFGVCLPDSCSSAELQSVFRPGKPFLSKIKKIIVNHYSFYCTSYAKSGLRLSESKRSHSRDQRWVLRYFVWQICSLIFDLWSSEWLLASS